MNDGSERIVVEMQTLVVVLQMAARFVISAGVS
jgi:hypothetical protein